MNRLEIMRARSLSKYVEMLTSRIEPLLFLFLIRRDGQEVRITLNHKGWMCDAMETTEEYSRRCFLRSRRNQERPTRWNHTMNTKECEHVLACKIYLQNHNINLERDSDDSEFSDLPPGTLQNLPDYSK